MGGTFGVAQLVDDNRQGTLAFTPIAPGQRSTGIETTTVRFATTDTSLVRIVSVGAINFMVSTSTTDSVTTSDCYLPAATPMNVKVVSKTETVQFIGSSIVYLTSLR